MNERFFIAGDWGTTNLRLYLCRFESGTTNVIERKPGPGTIEVDGNFEDTFFELCQNWFTKYGTIPVILSGMVGSNIGWKEAPYLSCPVGVSEITTGRLKFESRGIEISILAGLKTQNPLGQSDVMRGEELQVLGWQQINSESTQPRLFALPGTHNKWVLCQRNKLTTFLTAYSGELFGLIKSHGILVPDPTNQEFNKEAFELGTKVTLERNEASLLHVLFSTRSKQLMGNLKPQHTASYLSGLIIADDVRGALATFEPSFTSEQLVTVIAEDELSQLYKQVLIDLNICAESYSPLAIATAGYSAVYQSIYC